MKPTQKQVIEEIQQHPKITFKMMQEFSSRIATLATALTLVIEAIDAKDMDMAGFQEMKPMLQSILDRCIASIE